MVSLILAPIIGGFVILHVVVCFLLPGLTRPDMCFAVTVAPGFPDSSEGRAILRKYRIELTVLSAMSLVATVEGVWRLGAGFIPAGFVATGAASFAGFYRARRRVLPYAAAPTAIREADLHRSHQTVPGGRLLASGPFLVLGGCAAFPRPHGHEFRAGVLFLSTVGILAALTLIRYGMSHWVRSVYASGPRFLYDLRFRRIVSVLVLAQAYLIAIESSRAALIPHRRHWVEVFPMFMILALAAVLALSRFGQGGSRLASFGEASACGAVPVGDRTEDRRWKLGIFYFNPDDAAVIVEKRFGLAYTLNFARLATWIIVSFLLVSWLIPVLGSRFYRSRLYAGGGKDVVVGTRLR